MTIQVGDAATLSQKEVKRRYPVTKGLTAGTTKQEGTKTFLSPQNKSLVRKRNKEGI